jgi:hypothetical protein
MISFTDAQIEGAMDKKMQDKHNYLTQLLSQYLTRGLIESVDGKTYFDLKNSEIKETSTIDGNAIEITINPTVGFQIKSNGSVIGGITGEGYFIVQRLQSSEHASSYATMADPGAEDFNLWTYDENSVLHNFFKISHTLLSGDDAIITLGDTSGYVKTVTGWNDSIELYVEDSNTSDYVQFTITPTSVTISKNGSVVETW